MENFDYDNIYRYLGREMEGVELQEFEDAMRSNSDLADEVAFCEDLLKGVELAEDTALKEKIKNIHQKAADSGWLLQYDAIQDLINGKESDDRSVELQQQLTSDPILAADFQLEEDLLAGIELAGDEQLKKTIKSARTNMGKEIWTETEKKEPSGRIFSLPNFINMPTLAVAASVAILILVGYFFIQKPETTNQVAVEENETPATLTEEAIFAQSFEQESTILNEELEDLSMIGMAIPDKDRRAAYKSALELYQTENYQQAVTALEAFRNTYQDIGNAPLFLGLSYMELKEWEAAAIQLEQFISSSEADESTTAAKWYLGLTYLNLEGQKEQAVGLFKALSNVSNNITYQQKAQKILSELDKITE